MKMSKAFWANIERKKTNRLSGTMEMRHQGEALERKKSWNVVEPLTDGGLGAKDIEAGYKMLGEGLLWEGSTWQTVGQDVDLKLGIYWSSTQGTVNHSSLSILHTTLLPAELEASTYLALGQQKPILLGWGHGSTGKSTCCSLKGLEFSSQPPCWWLTTNHL